MSQGWSKIFNRINWLNRPNTNTPLNATNLNAGDSAIDALDDRIVQLDTLKADSSVLPSLVSSVSLDLDTGFLTVVRYGGQVSQYNTNLNKIAVNFEYDYAYQRLVLELPDGNKQYVDMSALITQYEFDDSDTIIFNALPNGHIKARIADGSIEDRHLKTDYLAEIKTEVAKATNMANSATTSSNSAYDNAKLSQSYAIGSAGVRDGEDTDNSKYYSEQAKKSATASANSASTASTKASEASSSASSASASATKSATSESNASKSASSAATSASTASTKASEASQSATSASGSASSASTSETNASESAESASTSATTAANNAKYATSAASSAASSASTASSSASDAANRATEAKAFANSASTSATAASTSASNAKASETASATSAKNAKTSETNAARGASTATSKASAASTSATNAATSEANAKKYYEQAKAISESFSGALRPMGTVTFANLPAVSSASSGDMYNISDEFVTTSDFVEGAGITEPAGSNVYKTEAGKWDVLAGSPVTGVKGANETTFRRGNVNITPDNIGAIPTSGGTVNGTITFGKNDSYGIRTNTDNYGRVGESTKQFFEGYFQKIYENKTLLSNKYLRLTGDSKDNTTTFTSNDSTTGDSTAPALLTSRETHASIFSKVSTIFKNVRWLLSKMGTTDISSLGDGTVTGAISTLNSNKVTNEIIVTGTQNAIAYSGTCYYHIFGKLCCVIGEFKYSSDYTPTNTQVIFKNLPIPVRPYYITALQYKGGRVDALYTGSIPFKMRVNEAGEIQNWYSGILTIANNPAVFSSVYPIK
nr:MAG TPA: hypothetical protein [Caudoviricetes sp.]